MGNDVTVNRFLSFIVMNVNQVLQYGFSVAYNETVVTLCCDLRMAAHNLVQKSERLVDNLCSRQKQHADLSQDLINQW